MPIPEAHPATHQPIAGSTRIISALLTTLILLVAVTGFSCAAATHRAQPDALAPPSPHPALLAELSFSDHSMNVTGLVHYDESARAAELEAARRRGQELSHGYIWDDGLALRVNGDGQRHFRWLPPEELLEIKTKAAVLRRNHGVNASHLVPCGSARTVRVRTGTSMSEYAWPPFEAMPPHYDDLNDMWVWSDTMLQSNARPIRDDPEVHNEIIQRLQSLGDTQTISLLAGKHTP